MKPVAITRSVGPASKACRAACAIGSRIGTLAILCATLALWSLPSHAQVDWTTAAQEGESFSLPAAKLVRYGEAFNNRWTPERSMTGTVLCANPTFTPPGDPSVGTGKVCQVKDIAVPAPSPILPPLTSGLTYVVTWTPPTTNTDGSPIGTVLRYLIQASAVSTFASYYQWESATAAASYTVTNGPSGTTFWRVAVETANGTSDYSATAITDKQWVAQQRPPCWPKPIGFGSWPNAAQNDAGWAVHWHCQLTNGTWVHAGRHGLWSQMDPDWMVQLAKALPGGEAAFNTLWDENGAGPTVPPSTYDPVRPLYAGLVNANPLPATATFKVATNGTLTTRPARSVVNGSLASTTAGRVAVGAPCNCAEFKSGSYCAVTGLPNLATADPADRLPSSAAICTN